MWLRDIIFIPRHKGNNKMRMKRARATNSTFVQNIILRVTQSNQTRREVEREREGGGYDGQKQRE